MTVSLADPSPATVTVTEPPGGQPKPCTTYSVSVSPWFWNMATFGGPPGPPGGNVGGKDGGACCAPGEWVPSTVLAGLDVLWPGLFAAPALLAGGRSSTPMPAPAAMSSTAAMARPASGKMASCRRSGLCQPSPCGAV